MFRFALCTYLTVASGLLSTGCGEGEAGAAGAGDGAAAAGGAAAASGGGGGSFMDSLRGFMGGVSAYGGTAGGLLSVFSAVQGFNKDDTGAANNNQVGAAVGQAAQGFSDTGARLGQRENAKDTIANEGATREKIASDKAALDTAEGTYRDTDARLRDREALYNDRRDAIRKDSSPNKEQRLNALYESEGKGLATERQGLVTERNRLNQQRAANDRYAANFENALRNSHQTLGTNPEGATAAERAMLQ